MFWDALPYYLSIGMTTDEYWNGDCLLVKAYRKADKLKRRRQNEALWLQGAYVYEAILDASPVLHAFSKRAKARPYPSEPYSITSEQRAEKKEREQQAAFERSKAHLMAWMATTNQSIKQREEVKQ